MEWPSSFYSCYLNCPILVGSRLHNGSIQASLTRWLGKKGKLSALSLSLSSSLLSAPCIFCRVALADRGVVSKSSSQLLSPHPTHSLRHEGRREHPPPRLSLRPRLEPAHRTASYHNTVEWAHGQLLFVCTIYVNVQSAANGSVMQSFILAVPRSRPLG